MKSNQGSDERMMAKDWFLRGAIAMPIWVITPKDNDRVSCIVNDFALMYTANYPSVDNTNYEEKRKKQLQMWYDNSLALKKLSLKQNKS